MLLQKMSNVPIAIVGFARIAHQMTLYTATTVTKIETPQYAEHASLANKMKAPNAISVVCASYKDDGNYYCVDCFTQ
jgi:uncharacterized membrane-anchored protein YitT (DUF2179 family)